MKSLTLRSQSMRPVLVVSEGKLGQTSRSRHYQCFLQALSVASKRTHLMELSGRRNQKVCALVDRGLSQEWSITVKELVAREMGLKHHESVLGTLAHRFPTSFSIKLKNAESESENWARSKVYWHNALHGKRTVKDNDLIERVNRQVIGAADLYRHPLWRLLRNPLAGSEELFAMLGSLHIYLDGMFFSVDAEQRKLTYQSEFMHSDIAHQTDTVHLLTLRLILLRLSIIQDIDLEFPCDVLPIVLLMTRIYRDQVSLISRAHIFQSIAIFVAASLEEDENTAYELIRDPDIEMAFKYLLSKSVPSFARLPSIFDSYKAYQSANKELVNESRSNFGFVGLFDDAWDRSHRVLYWADSLSHLWMYGQVKKEQIFDEDSALHSLGFRMLYKLEEVQVW